MYLVDYRVEIEYNLCKMLPEYGMPIPSEYIHRSTLKQHLPSQQFAVMNDYVRMLQRLQMQPFSPKDFDNLGFQYHPRLPAAHSDSFHPLLPILEVPYMLTAAIATDQITVNKEMEEEQRARLKSKIIHASLHLLSVINLATVARRMEWSEPTKLEDSRGYKFTGMNRPWGKGLVEVVRSVKLQDLFIRWHEYDPNNPATQGRRPSCLVAEFRCSFERVDFLRESVRIEMDVYENRWGQKTNGKTRLATGAGVKVLDKYLSPYHPHMKVAEGYLPQSRSLEDLLLSTLHIEWLNPRGF